MCAAFGCPPDVALRQDLHLVRAILDYRNAQHAVALLRDTRDGLKALGEQPALGDLLLELNRAQRGEASTLADLAAAYAPTDDDEEDA